MYPSGAGFFTGFSRYAWNCSQSALVWAYPKGVGIGRDPTASVYLIRPDPATIDPWFLAGLLSSSDGGRQAARMANSLGEHIRFDPRRVRVPLPPIDSQRAYGEAFRRLWEFTRTLRAAHDLGIDFVRDMIDATTEPLRQTSYQEESPPSVRAT